MVAALSLIAYWAVDANYRSLLAPALDTPEGRAGLAAALKPALYAILSADAFLLLLVGAASYALAKAAIAPLTQAREREERFAADVAHELRTPLGAIASLAQAHADPEHTDDPYNAIAKRAIECGTLVSDLLTLARDGDEAALDREPVDLALVTERCAREIDGMEVRGTYESAIVDGDERRLLQLVRNLLWNARAHARVTITVRVTVESGFAVLTVDDDGPGVPETLVPHLFERFAKGDESRGSGLGLAIGRWVARAHGGELSYAGGATFVARLPILMKM